MTQTLYFKMSNGEDIIASCDQEDSEKFLIKYPFTLQQITAGNSETHLMLYPWVPSPTLMKESFIFMKTNIIAVALAPDSFSQAHSRAWNALSNAMIEPIEKGDNPYEDLENPSEEETTTVSRSTRTLH